MVPLRILKKAEMKAEIMEFYRTGLTLPLSPRERDRVR
jgi:hypothetical protein